MRLARTVGAFLVVILTVTILGPAALVSPAQAAKPKHEISVQGGEIRNTNKFYLKGKVATHKKRNIKILRNVSGGPYKVYKKVKTNKKGKFNVRIEQVGRKRTCFKVQVPGNKNYRKTTTPNIGCITSR